MSGSIMIKEVNISSSATGGVSTTNGILGLGCGVQICFGLGCSDTGNPKPDGVGCGGACSGGACAGAGAGGGCVIAGLGAGCGAGCGGAGCGLLC